jgi:hypothetical protein
MITDFNNGLILGLSLQGTIFSGGGATDVVITAMESAPIEFRVKYNEDTEWTIFDITSNETGTIIYTSRTNGAFIIFTPILESEIIYNQLEV